MRTQAASIVACDLFTVETASLKTLHVVFFIDLHTRRVLIGGVTDGATNVRWCTQIARNLSETRSTPLRFSSTTETIDSESRSTKCSRRRVWRSFAPRG
jgi:putative transposase